VTEVEGSSNQTEQGFKSNPFCQVEAGSGLIERIVERSPGLMVTPGYSVTRRALTPVSDGRDLAYQIAQAMSDPVEDVANRLAAQCRKKRCLSGKR
jgi:hypothetical protein